MNLRGACPYRNRSEKANYVWQQYGSFLTGKVLDVGADKGHLRSHLPDTVEYVTVGLEPDHEIKADLEKGIHIESNSYHCVLCLDVLEHIENIHGLFDDLCRVTARYLIVSLPNPWSTFVRTLRNGPYDENRPMKFYGLPVDPPADRHRWFFNATEARRFLEERGNRNGLRLIHFEHFGANSAKARFHGGLLSCVVSRSFRASDLLGDTMWAVLEKHPSATSGPDR